MAYQSIHTGLDIDTGITNIQQIFNLIYPVGSYYMSSSATNPGTLFGGTWEQITDRMIMAAGSTYAVDTTGGAASHTHTSAAHTHTTAGHTLTENEMPRHTHGYSSWQDGYPTAIAATSTYRTPLVLISAGLDGNPIANTFCLNVGGGASHSHGNTGSTTPGNTGSSSNLPPYIVAYIWRRIA